jgi:ribosomal protein L11 methyltransferase
LFTVSIQCPTDLSEDQVGCFLPVLEDDALATSMTREGNIHTGAWRVEGWFSDKPDEAALSTKIAVIAASMGVSDNGFSVTVAPVPEVDWLEHSYRQFPAFAVGRFFIYGSHHDGNVPDGLDGLQIDAATAFGSGEHGTTAGCLEALQDLQKQGAAFKNVLDMGTGSGILAIAAWKLWRCPVLAVDIDPESVIVAARHRDINVVSADGMVCVEGSTFDQTDIAARQPFDLICANILAAPLKDMAHDLCNVVAKGGFIVLSGMLNDQADSVRECYEREGMTFSNALKRGDWTTLVMQAC